MGGYAKLFLPEKVLSPTLALTSGVSYPDKVFFGEAAVANRFDIGNEIQLRAGILGTESCFYSLSSRHRLSVFTLAPEIKYMDSAGGLEWLREEINIDLGVSTNYFYQEYYPFLFRRGVLGLDLFTGYNLSRGNIYAMSYLENHTILGFGIHEILFDFSFGFTTIDAPLTRFMNLRETASFRSDDVYGRFKAFDGIGYQVRLFSIWADLLQFKAGSMVQMGILKPEIPWNVFWDTEDFYGEVIVFCSLRLFNAIEFRLGGALDFEELRTADFTGTSVYISLFVLYEY
jgi:hypothetical protein